MKILIFCLASALVFPSVADSADPRLYTVKPGDTLSQIAQTYIGSPVYPSASGSLNALVGLNPVLKKSPAIYPGQVLVLSAQGAADRAPAPSRKLASQSGTEAPAEEQAGKPAGSDSQAVRHKLSLSARYGITTLAATDTASSSVARLFSKRDATLMLAWKQEWTESFSTKIQGSFRDIDFEPPSNSAKTLSSSHKNITGLEFEAGHSVSDRLQLLFRMRYESRLFVRGANAVSVVIDSVPLPEAGAEIRYDFLKKGNTSLGLAAGGSYLFSGSADSYKVLSGYVYSGGLLVKHKAPSSAEVSLGLSYQSRSQNTAAVRVRENSVLGTFSLGLPIFEEAK